MKILTYRFSLINQPEMPGMPDQPGPGIPPGSVGPMGGPMGARGPGGQSVLLPSRFLQPVSYAVMHVFFFWY
jgi:hypothetical protein